jgi:glycosyltransferase involved in cell wall biosynthesis
MEKVKVCHFTTAHPEKDIRIFYKECISLSNAGFDVHLVVTNLEGSFKTFKENGVTIHSLPRNIGRYSRMWTAVNDMFKYVRNLNADIYHFHDPELLRIAYRLKKKNNFLIYDIHDDVPAQINHKEWIPLIFRKVLSGIARIIENYFAYKMDGLVIATDTISSKYKFDNKITIQNFPILGELATTNTYESRANSVCYIGSISITRGFKEMIESVENLNTDLILAGIIDDPEVDQLLNHTQNHRIKYCGKLNREEVQKLLSESKVGLCILYPVENYILSQPTKLYEYMSASIPFVASDFKIIKDIVERYHCGICVNPLDTNAIRDAIQFLIDNPRESEAMGKRGFEAVKENYSWESQAHKLTFFYKKLLQLKS